MQDVHSSVLTRAGKQANPGRASGWHPDRIDPNLQNFWDGSGWTAHRRWVNGRWVDAGADAAAPPLSLSPPPHSLLSPPSVDATRTVTAGAIGLLVCSLLLVLGSLTPWISVSLGSVHGTIAGTDAGISSLIGVNGWVTFAAGTILFVLAGLTMLSGEGMFSRVALLVSLIAGGLAVYDLIRILQKTPTFAASVHGFFQESGLSPDANVAYGLIIVVVASFGAVCTSASGVRRP